MKTILLALFMNPPANIILMTIMIGGLVMELKMPGKMIPLLCSLAAALLYFVPYYTAGTVETWELFMFIVGFIFLVLEIFVIPGFGIVGVSGFGAIFAALALVTLKNHYLDFSQVTEGQISQAVLTTLAGALCSVGLMIAVAHTLTKTVWFKKVSLQTVLSNENGYHLKQENLTTLVGEQGVVYTVLRPSGKVLIHNTIYEASAKNKFIDKGTIIEVVAIEGNALQVKIIA
jgi:membrane-bound serine protease (ClpP class)